MLGSRSYISLAKSENYVIIYVSFQTCLHLLIWKTNMKYFSFCAPMKKVNRDPGCQAPKCSSVHYTKLSYRVYNSEDRTEEQHFMLLYCDFEARHPRSFTFIKIKRGQDIQHFLSHSTKDIHTRLK